MQTNIEKTRADIKHANTTFIVQFVGVVIAALAAGAALGHYFIK